MPRHRFGADLTAVLWRAVNLADGTLAVLQLVPGGGPVAAWDAETGGTQVTDLQTPAGAAIPGGELTANAGGLLDFLGPDTTPDTVELWLDAGALLDGQPMRQRIVAADLAPTIITNAGIVTQHTDDVAGLDTRLDALEAKPYRDSADFTFGEAAPGTIGGHRWYNRSGRTLTILGVQASATVAPQGGTTGLRFDVNRNGTTIFGTQANRPTIPVGQNEAPYATGHTVTTLADGQYLTADIDDAGTTTPGANIGVQVWLAG